MAKKSVFWRDFKHMDKSQIKDMLEQDVYSTDEFKRHIEEVSIKTGLETDLITSVLKSYFTNILIVINSNNKLKTIINLYAFAKLVIKRGKRI